MKIEKLNDHQIRCTLTEEDLAQREIKLSELAYGSEKAKSLFRDMMQQASMDLGFEAEEVPIMVEAIPVSPGKIVLIITKVDSPEELDTRFSSFTQFEEEESPEAVEIDDNMQDSDPVGEVPSDIIDLFRRLKQESDELANKQSPENTKKENLSKSRKAKSSQVHVYTAGTMDQLVTACSALHDYYQGSNTLYKDPASGLYYLVLTQGKLEAGDFSRTNNLLAEYLTPVKYTPTALAFYREHYKVIISKNAVQTLSKLN